MHIWLIVWVELGQFDAYVCHSRELLVDFTAVLVFNLEKTDRGLEPWFNISSGPRPSSTTVFFRVPSIPRKQTLFTVFLKHLQFAIDTTD